MSLECVKCVFYILRQAQVKIKKKSNSEQENKGSITLTPTRHLAQLIETVTLTPVDSWFDQSRVIDLQNFET